MRERRKERNKETSIIQQENNQPLRPLNNSHATHSNVLRSNVSRKSRRAARCWKPTWFEFDESAAVGRGAFRKHQHLSESQEQGLIGYEKQLQLFQQTFFFGLDSKNIWERADGLVW